jgi:nucleotide-binding universal stress UspA family protein
LENGKSSLAKIVCETVPEDISVEVLVETGDPAMVIADAAVREKIDVIVLATHGLTGLSHLLMGSVAEKVVRHAAVPVLIVRQSEEGESRPPEKKEE